MKSYRNYAKVKKGPFSEAGNKVKNVKKMHLTYKKQALYNNFFIIVLMARGFRLWY